MILTRRALTLALAAAPFATPALAEALAPADQALVDRAVAYLQGMGEVKARFVQTDARGQVSRGGTAGQVDDRHLTVRGEPVGGGHRQHGGPAGERAARDVNPVDPVGNGDGVPALLGREGQPLPLPLDNIARVLGMRPPQLGVPVGEEACNTHSFCVHSPPQRPLTAPDRLDAQPGDREAGGDRRPSGGDGHPACAIASRDHGREHGHDAGREPERPRDQVFLPPLCR